MSSENLMTNNEFGIPYIKINRNLSTNLSMLYGAPTNGAPPRKDFVDAKLRTTLAQLPPKERPDISLMQHLVKQEMKFTIPIKKKPPQIHQRQVSYIQPIPSGGIKPSHATFKRLQPCATTITPSTVFEPPRMMMNFQSVPDALEALKIPSPTASNDSSHFSVIQIYPSSKILSPSPYQQQYQQRSSMSPNLLPPASLSTINQEGKRGRVKIIHPASAAASENPAPPRKKYKPRKSASTMPATVTNHSHSSSEPPQSAPPPTTKNNHQHHEKSGTPTLNEDYTVRRSGRKVIKPAHLAADIGITSNNGDKYINHETNASTNGTTSDGETKNYYECAATLPELMEQLDLTKIEEEEKDLDELTIIPKNMEDLDEQELERYVLACQAKVKCDAHIAFMHLAANEYCIKKALETFDLKDSLPQTHLLGKDSAGIWTLDELKTFVRLMNNNKCYKRMNKISKHITEKSTANVVNAYYALKKGVCSFGREFTICPEIIETQKPILGYEFVDSTKCENCVKQLWEKSDVEEFNAESLCSLCKLYHTLYEKLRPNAESTPQIFDDTRLKHDACSYEMMKDDFDEIFIPDWNVLKMNVYKIKSTSMKDFADAVKDLKLDENTQNLLTEVEKMNENNTYIFFSEKPLTNIPQFYPKNGIPLVECLSFTDPPISSNPPKEESPKPVAAVSGNPESDDENDGPPILVNEVERIFKEKQKITEKSFDVFYFGFLDEMNELHNEHGLEFHHAYLEKLHKFSDPLYLSSAKKFDDSKPLGSCAEKDLADKEIIEKYGNISFSVFSQTFLDSKKKFQTAAESLNVPLEFLEAYVRQNYYNLKVYFAQFERMIKTRARRAKGRNRAADEREKRPNYFSFDEPPKKLHNYFLAL